MTPGIGLPPPSERPIGVFDSGIGGLTVARSLIRHLPGESLVYLGDTARVPYGTKSPETVTRFSAQNVNYLRQWGVKLVVVACHTASSCALPGLESRFEFPLVGVIGPGSRQAVAASRTGRIGVIGTRATVASGAFEREITALLPAAHVFAHACPLFVPLVEEGWEGSDVAGLVARKYLLPLKAEKIDCLVLGCTHYPLLRSLIQEMVGRDVALVDPGEETAREVGALLDRAGLRRRAEDEPTLRVIVSDLTPRMRELSTTILGREVTAIEKVPLDTLEGLDG